jgi:hypothetical protein
MENKKEDFLPLFNVHFNAPFICAANDVERNARAYHLRP